ncbi:DUF1617 family protein [Alkalihalobacillus sp. LMS39]|uniref:DUF1617 family protein n=1 Tax=Alkalihalobacillus sp. LMS39 TaxID=2924032 RepID=UPI001FB436EE|nr:DUF1617 family protein [Alkalihalobacillus sp. LMS39]UOE96081.1 DUF1617 family protein [Alkalihalobacillus sp. LMS39]
MQVKIQNGKLGQAINLLFNLSLKGKKSRHRTKFIKLLDERLREVAEQEQELLKEHCHLDGKGDPKKTDDGKSWDVKDKEAFLKDKKELYEEEMVIEGGDVSGMLKTVKEILDECEEEWQGAEATTYFELCEIFDEGVNE